MTSKDWDDMIISHAPNGRYRSGWDRIYGNKESVMENTDCDNCLYLEAQNADLEQENMELREQLEAFRDQVEKFVMATDDI